VVILPFAATDAIARSFLICALSSYHVTGARYLSSHCDNADIIDP
jgi:hypothetical protein